jgi:hypothetical protein
MNIRGYLIFIKQSDDHLYTSRMMSIHVGFIYSLTKMSNLSQSILRTFTLMKLGTFAFKTQSCLIIFF